MTHQLFLVPAIVGSQARTCARPAVLCSSGLCSRLLPQPPPPPPPLHLGSPICTAGSLSGLLRGWSDAVWGSPGPREPLIALSLVRCPMCCCSLVTFSGLAKGRGPGRPRKTRTCRRANALGDPGSAPPAFNSAQPRSSGVTWDRCLPSLSFGVPTCEAGFSSRSEGGRAQAATFVLVIGPAWNACPLWGWLISRAHTHLCGFRTRAPVPTQDGSAA